MNMLQKLNAENQPPVGAKPENQQSQAATPAPATASGPRPPVESKPSVGAATAPTQNNAKHTSAGLKDSKIVPAVPVISPSSKNILAAAPPANLAATAANAGNKAPAPAAAPNKSQAAASAAAQYHNATTQAATAAVAAAMAKLAPSPRQKREPVSGNAVDNLTQKVNEMRVDNNSRTANTSRGRGRGGRGGRGRGIEVPRSDFDFESSNARFNKQDLVKEAIGTGETPDGEIVNGATDPPTPNGTADVQTPPTVPYSSKSGFFDNISSEARDRQESADGKRRPNGPELRIEERKRNMETFGMGSVDGGYRGGYRGRGRGRGHRGFGGRGAYNRGGYRGRGVGPFAHAGAEA